MKTATETINSLRGHFRTSPASALMNSCLRFQLPPKTSRALMSFSPTNLKTSLFTTQTFSSRMAQWRLNPISKVSLLILVHAIPLPKKHFLKSRWKRRPKNLLAMTLFPYPKKIRLQSLDLALKKSRKKKAEERQRKNFARTMVKTSFAT